MKYVLQRRRFAVCVNGAKKIFSLEPTMRQASMCIYGAHEPACTRSMVTAPIFFSFHTASTRSRRWIPQRGGKF
jgi:hypothetical protein